MKDPILVTAFTSIRSEYGPLRPLLRWLRGDPRFRLNLLVGGAHLLPDFGNSITEIRKDGFVVTREFPFVGADNSLRGKANDMADLQRQAADYFNEYPHDMLLVLGDRFELLPLVSTALVMNIPVLHLSGGEITEGALDNQVRHAVSKMAHLHFTATHEYKINLQKMGEEEWRVCHAGEPGLDQVRELPIKSRGQLFDELGLHPEKKLVLATFHPETIYNQITVDLIDAVARHIIGQGYQILFTASNFDFYGVEINQRLAELSETESAIFYRENLGQLNYYSVLRHATLMVGNSSSGLIEAQSFNLPVVNVGKRQDGRLANLNVVHAQPTVAAVVSAMNWAVSPEFRTQFHNQANIYGDGKACERIAEFLVAVPKGNLLLKKTVF